jgi:hypothetical protein
MPPKSKPVSKRKRAGTGNSTDDGPKSNKARRRRSDTVEEPGLVNSSGELSGFDSEHLSDAATQSEPNEKTTPEPRNLRRSTRANRNEHPAFNVQEGELYKSERRAASQAKKNQKTARANAKVAQKAAEQSKVAAGTRAISDLVRSREARNAAIFAEDHVEAPTTEEYEEDELDDTEMNSVHDSVTNDEEDTDLMEKSPQPVTVRRKSVSPTAQPD